MSCQISDIDAVYARVGSVEARIWKQVAYVGRYGNQPVSEALRLTVRQLDRLANNFAEIVREENAATRFSPDMG